MSFYEDWLAERIVNYCKTSDWSSIDQMFDHIQQYKQTLSEDPMPEILSRAFELIKEIDMEVQNLTLENFNSCIEGIIKPLEVQHGLDQEALNENLAAEEILIHCQNNDWKGIKETLDCIKRCKKEDQYDPIPEILRKSFLLIQKLDPRRRDLVRDYLSEYIVREKRFPSVTYILDANEVKYVNAASASNHQEHERSNPNVAKAQGSQLHLAISDFLRFGVYPDPLSEIKEYWDSIKLFLWQVKSNVYCDWIEKAITFPMGSDYKARDKVGLGSGYSGRLDCIANYEGYTCLIEWKSSFSGDYKKSLRRYELQCAAYVLACRDIYQIDVNALIIAIAIPGQEAEILFYKSQELNALCDRFIRELQFFSEYQSQEKRHYTEDSIRLYLQEIGRISLLSEEEEIELAKKITDLLKLEYIFDDLFDNLDVDFSGLSQELTVEEWKQWAAAVMQKEGTTFTVEAFLRRVHVGWRAKDKMVHSNLRLVVSIAKKYMNRGLSFQDLVQEGSLGLIRAAEKFDHEKGYKFSTYAIWWIRQAITCAIVDQSRTIRLPVHLHETISRIKKTTKLLSQEIGRKPTDEEIATRMEMSVEKLRFITMSAQLPMSLDTFINKEEDLYSGNTLASLDGILEEESLCLDDLIESNGETPEDQVSKSLLREDLESVLGTLSPRERDVLRLRYGLDDGRMKSLEEIGQIFNVTRERIRQIEAKALRKLRHPNRNSILKQYVRSDLLENSD
jgi:RNA polymerase primary sigma factor